MLCTHMRSLCSLGLLLAACVGAAPLPPVDGSVDEPAAQGQRVSGRAMDYFSTNTPIQGASLATDGVVPELTATSAADGRFAFPTVPVGSQLFISLSRATYQPTRNLIAIADASIDQDLYLISTSDIGRQYATDGGKSPTPGRAFVIAELLRSDGSPLAGVALTAVQLVGANDVPLAGVFGPYVIGAAGDILPPPGGPTATTAYNGKSRVAFLDVPAGTSSLKVTYTDGGEQKTITTPVSTAADGATIVRSGGMRDGGSVPSGGGAQNPRFATDIYPRLQTAANGGRGCANCHMVGGTGSVAVFNALASDVLAALKAKPGLINVADPPASLLLTKPLYEPSPATQNHPNATYVDANDGDYKLIVRWIQQGAL